jgi:hypothetical protein
MALTLNGFGTSYYGARWLPDGTYITTKWVVVLFVPIFPVESVRILQTGPRHEGGVYSRQSLITQPVPLDKNMVLKMYGLLALFAVLLACVPWFNRFAELLRI